MHPAQKLKLTKSTQVGPGGALLPPTTNVRAGRAISWLKENNDADSTPSQQRQTKNTMQSKNDTTTNEQEDNAD